MQLYKCKNALNQTVHITYILYGDQTVCDFCIKVCIWCLYFVFRYYVTDTSMIYCNYLGAKYSYHQTLPYTCSSQQIIISES